MEINREDFKEVVVNIGRVTKVVKGGRRFRFNALVVVGNKEGLVGFGLGKAKEVPDAIKKAIDDAFKNIIKINIKGTTIAHDVQQKYNSSIIFKRLLYRTFLKINIIELHIEPEPIREQIKASNVFIRLLQ